MATIKISQLPEKATMAGTEEVLINDSGTSKKFSTQRFLDVKTSTETARDAALAAQTAAETAETNAETAETNASGSATTAGTHATNASTSETNAATSETNAATSATSASGSATAAAASAASAAATYDTFDDRYLGNKASDPTTDNDGDALVQGMLYFDSTNNLMKVYDGSVWITTSSATLSTLDVYKFTATSGQTAFTGTDDDGNTLAIKPTAEMVTMNGIVLEPTADYTVTSSTLTLTTGATTGDEVNVYAFGNFELADHYSKVTSDGRYLQDSEVTNLAQVKAFDSSDYATAAQGTTADNALPKAGGTLTGDLSLGDNVKAKLGAGDDLQIYHDGSNSYIKDDGTGDLNISGGDDLRLRTPTGENGLILNQDSSLKLYHDNSPKLSTTSNGIDVTGRITTDGIFEDTSGNVGIGTSSPSNTLTVKKDVDDYIAKLENDGNSTSSNGLWVDTRWNTATNTVFKVTTNSGSSNVIVAKGDGNVGIGTSSPSAKATIEDGDFARLDLNLSNATGTTIADVRGLVEGTEKWRIGKTGSSSDDFAINVTGTERMRIDSSGNVLVGTTYPGAAGLSVNGGANFSFAENANSSFANIFRQSNSAATVLANGYKSTATSNKMASSYGSNWAKSAVSLNYGTVRFYTDSATTTSVGTDVTPTERMRIDSSGNVGIGTSSPSEKLYVSGNIYATGNITAYSDERIKENIVEIPNALDAVDNIRGVSYTRTDTKEDSVGVIAQEVEAMFPELITENNEGMKSVNYNGLVGVLFSAVKELSAKVKELEAK